MTVSLVASPRDRRVQPRWFLTADFPALKTDAGGPRFPKGVTAHAKRMGTVVTACGIPALSWQRHWTQPFPSLTATNCSDCLAVVAAGWTSDR